MLPVARSHGVCPRFSYQPPPPNPDPPELRGADVIALIAGGLIMGYSLISFSQILGAPQVRRCCCLILRILLHLERQLVEVSIRPSRAILQPLSPSSW